MCDIYTSKPVGILILAFNWSTVRFSLASKTGDEDPRPVLGKKKVPYQYDGYLGHKCTYKYSIWSLYMCLIYVIMPTIL